MYAYGKIKQLLYLQHTNYIHKCVVSALPRWYVGSQGPRPPVTFQVRPQNAYVNMITALGRELVATPDSFIIMSFVQTNTSEQRNYKDMLELSL